MAPGPIRLHLLGTPRVTESDGAPVDFPLGKPFALLVYLALHPSPATREELGRLLWSGSDPKSAQGSVRTALTALRKRLGCGEAELGDPVRLPPGAVETDVDHYRAALVADRLDEAMELWRGPLLDRFAVANALGWNGWMEEQRSRLEHEFGAALLRHAERLRQSGDPTAALAYLDRAAEVQPYAGKPLVSLIEVLLDVRRFDEAEAALARARSHADDEASRREVDTLEARLHSLRRGAADAGTESAVRPEFVGRTEEFAELLRLWRTARAGSGRVALLLGPPGIGKTRLAAELGVVVRSEGGGVVAVKAMESERRMEWAVVVEMIRALYPLPGSAGVSTASDLLLHELVPSLSTATSADRAPGAAVSASRAAQVADALGDLIAAVADERPLLVLVDDLQWVDPSSRMVLSQIARRLRGMPGLLLFTCRSGVADPAVPEMVASLMRLEAAYRAELRPLSDGEVAEMLGFLATDPAAGDVELLARRIQERAYGHPFFIVELLKVLFDESVIEAAGEGRWRVHADRLDRGIRLPENVRALLFRRLDGLSDDAVAAAAALTRLDGSAPLDAVGDRAGLGSARLTRAVNELLTREIVQWGPDDTLRFSHDELRAAAAERFRPMVSRPPAAKRHPLGLAAAAVVVLFTAAALFASRESPAPAPPFGGGTLLVEFGHSEWLAALPSATGSGWEVRPADIWHPETTFRSGPFRTTSGDVLWFGENRPRFEEQVLLQLSPDGQQPVVGGPGDKGVLGASPDGRHVVYFSQRMDLPGSGYGHDLYVAGIDGSHPRRLYRAPEKLGGAAWSPDGSRIAFVIVAPTDTLAVINPDGQRVASFSFRDLQVPVWCGGGQRLLQRARTDGGWQLVEINVETGEQRTVPLAGDYRGRGLACSPDGSAVAYATVLRHRPAIVVQHLGTGEVSQLPVADRWPSRLAWLPDAVPPVPAGVGIRSGPVTLQWGERRGMAAEVIYSDGSRRQGPLAWESLDPGVASITPDGTVSGNQPGTTRIVASRDGWHADTLRVTVLGGIGEGALLHDPFTTLDRHRWIAFGSPHPFPTVRDGGPVLSLNGDGWWADGIIMRDPIPLPRGGTLEFEFRLRLTERRDLQRIGACLVEADPPQASEADDWTRWSQRQEICFGYPWGELAKFRRDEVGFNGNPVAARTLFPTHQWVHVALELRADGSSALYLDRQFVVRDALHVRNDPDTRWRIQLVSAAVDTEALVRNLVLWPGTRFLGDEARE